jgi:hypothetical protein
MNQTKIDRLNELNELDKLYKKTLSHNKYSSWYRRVSYELSSLRCELENEQKASPRTSHTTDEPATTAQLRYLVDLGVNISGRNISKMQASKLITAVKSGEGVGMYGFAMIDGSN